MARRRVVPPEERKPIIPPVNRHRHKGLIRYSLVEAREQEQRVEALMIAGKSTTQIQRELRKSDKPIRANRVGTLIERIRTKWSTEDDVQRAFNKAAAIRRIKGHLEEAKGELDAQGHYYNAKFSDIAKFEALLADLEDTRAPLKVNLDVQVSSAVAHVIAQLTPDQVQLALSQQRDLEMQAEAYRNTITVPALPAKSG